MGPCNQNTEGRRVPLCPRPLLTVWSQKNDECCPYWQPLIMYVCDEALYGGIKAIIKLQSLVEAMKQLNAQRNGTHRHGSQLQPFSIAAEVSSLLK